MASGKKILWHLDLGLFDRLKMPLSNSSQFLTLGLAVDHFRDTIWKEFRSFSEGVCLYKGPADLAKASGEYLRLLAERIPDEIPMYLEFDNLPEDVLERALLTNPERFGRINVRPNLWKTEEERKTAICMPPLDVFSDLEPFREALFKYPDAKLIPEERLTCAWEGLELLLYCEKCLSKQGWRKIQGFVAAGGQIQNLP